MSVLILWILVISVLWLRSSPSWVFSCETPSQEPNTWLHTNAGFMVDLSQFWFLAYRCLLVTQAFFSSSDFFLLQVCPSYLSRSWRSSPSPRWSGSGTRRARSWELALPVAGYALWFGPDTNRDARSAVPAAPLSGLQTKAVWRSEIINN